MTTATKSTKSTKTIWVEVKEYDNVDGCTQCVQRGEFQATWLGSTEATVRNLLAGGDYSEGDGEKRYVEIEIGGKYHGSYTASQIRRFRHRAGTL